MARFYTSLEQALVEACRMCDEIANDEKPVPTKAAQERYATYQEALDFMTHTFLDSAQAAHEDVSKPSERTCADTIAATLAWSDRAIAETQRVWPDAERRKARIAALAHIKGHLEAARREALYGA